MKRVFNFVGYEAVWFAAVIGAGRGAWWPGVAAAVAFALLHPIVAAESARARAADFKLFVVASAMGASLDGALALSGLIDYAADDVAWPPGGAPLWILAMWASFALTLRHSMAPLVRRPALAAFVGAIFGPLAYLGAARGWNAAAFAEPMWRPMAALAIGWAIAMAALAVLARRWPSDAEASSAPQPTQAV